MNESHFSTLTFLPFELYLHKHHVASSSSENQKAAEFFNRRFLKKKRWTIPHEKCHFLFDMVFLVEEITNLTSNLT
jgi:hypothetical protein